MEYLEFLKNLHDECLELSKEIRFDEKNPRQLHLIGLYGSVIELSFCVIVLINERLQIGVPCLFRSILETFVEFNNLYVEAEYGYNMEASFNKEWCKVLREAKKNTNPYLSEYNKSDKLDSLILEHEKELKSLIDRGYHPLNIYERFKKAGMTNEYNSLYNFLSRDAHSNISALIGRHYEVDGNNLKVTFYKDVPLENFVLYIDSIAGILIKAT
jgi:hypothetical protein